MNWPGSWTVRPPPAGRGILILVVHTVDEIEAIGNVPVHTSRIEEDR